MKNFIAILLIVIGFSCPAFAQVIDSPQVKTANGIVQGYVMASGIHSFKGIPYAQPPVGDLRWKEPQAPKNWKGILHTDHFGPQAMQEYIFNDMMFRSNGKSENCLYLNIWEPANAKPGSALPVLVYFYGGGFRAGDGSEYRYDGESLAKRGIIAITINYRLGIFGFMAHPELTAESPHHSSGNYGLMDQHAALVWVQKNIAAFGGDPNRVTIAGESAGSESVASQVTSPLSKGLFAGAIAESGSDLGESLPRPLAVGELAGVEFAAKVGATSLADLRKIPADTLLKLSGSFHFPEVIDGYFIPESPQAIFEAGKEMQVPLLAGWNSAEVDYHSVINKDSATTDNYKKALTRLYGDKAADVLNVYPANTDADVKQAATDLAADRFIVYATWKFIDMQSKTNSKPVYSYIFSRVRQNKVGKSIEMGAAHSSEIEYALGNLATNPVYNWSADDYKVSNEMESYFANFIKTGNPNGPGLPEWMNFKTSGQRLIIDVNTISVPQKNRDRYNLLDSIYKQ
jgi:para-nitrobenzyl esterase